MTHYGGQVVQEPVVSVGRVEEGRLHVRSTFGGEEERGVFLRTAEDADCTCDVGRGGETTWCYDHNRGWVDGHETPCWRCSFSALRGEPCPGCRAYFLAEGRRALREGRHEQAAVLLARALELGAEDGSLRFLFARALRQEAPSIDTWIPTRIRAPGA